MFRETQIFQSSHLDYSQEPEHLTCQSHLKLGPIYVWKLKNCKITSEGSRLYKGEPRKYLKGGYHVYPGGEGRSLSSSAEIQDLGS